MEDGARVLGETSMWVRIGRRDTGAVSDPFLRPWRTGAVLNWVWSTIFLAVVALIVTAIAPGRWRSSVTGCAGISSPRSGWGALGCDHRGAHHNRGPYRHHHRHPPGHPLAVRRLCRCCPSSGWWLWEPRWVGSFSATRRWKRDRVMLAAVVGVIIINLLRWIPVGGFIILASCGWWASVPPTWPSGPGCATAAEGARRGWLSGRGGPGGLPPMIPSTLGARVAAGSLSGRSRTGCRSRAGCDAGAGRGDRGRHRL